MAPANKLCSLYAGAQLTFPVPTRHSVISILGGQAWAGGQASHTGLSKAISLPLEALSC